MFHHPALAIGSYSIGPAAAGTIRTKSTGGVYHLDVCAHIKVFLPLSSVWMSFMRWFPDAPEAAVEPLADGQLGHLFLNHVLKLLPRKQLLQLQRFPVEHDGYMCTECSPSVT